MQSQQTTTSENIMVLVFGRQNLCKIPWSLGEGYVL